VIRGQRWRILRRRAPLRDGLDRRSYRGFEEECTARDVPWISGDDSGTSTVVMEVFFLVMGVLFLVVSSAGVVLRGVLSRLGTLDRFVGVKSRGGRFVRMPNGRRLGVISSLTVARVSMRDWIGELSSKKEVERGKSSESRGGEVVMGNTELIEVRTRTWSCKLWRGALAVKEAVSVDLEANLRGRTGDHLIPFMLFPSAYEGSKVPRSSTHAPPPD
jgi:hypothetical protein